MDDPAAADSANQAQKQQKTNHQPQQQQQQQQPNTATTNQSFTPAYYIDKSKPAQNYIRYQYVNNPPTTVSSPSTNSAQSQPFVSNTKAFRGSYTPGADPNTQHYLIYQPQIETTATNGAADVQYFTSTAGSATDTPTIYQNMNTSSTYLTLPQQYHQMGSFGMNAPNTAGNHILLSNSYIEDSADGPGYLTYTATPLMASSSKSGGPPPMPPPPPPSVPPPPPPPPPPPSSQQQQPSSSTTPGPLTTTNASVLTTQVSRLSMNPNFINFFEYSNDPEEMEAPPSNGMLTSSASSMTLANYGSTAAQNGVEFNNYPKTSHSETNLSIKSGMQLPKYVRPKVVRTPVLIHSVISKRVIKPKVQRAVLPPDSHGGEATLNASWSEQLARSNTLTDMQAPSLMPPPPPPPPPYTYATNDFQFQSMTPVSSTTTTTTAINANKMISMSSPQKSAPTVYSRSQQSTTPSNVVNYFTQSSGPGMTVLGPPPPPPPPPPSDRPVPPPNIPPPILRNNIQLYTSSPQPQVYIHSNSLHHQRTTNVYSSVLNNNLNNRAASFEFRKSYQQHHPIEQNVHILDTSAASSSALNSSLNTSTNTTNLLNYSTNSFLNNSNLTYATSGGFENPSTLNYHAMLVSPNLVTLFDKKKNESLPPPPPYPGDAHPNDAQNFLRPNNHGHHQLDQSQRLSMNGVPTGQIASPSISSVVRYCSPQAFKFYMEQHAENVLKHHKAREFRSVQLEIEMKKASLSADQKEPLRRLLRQKETEYLRLRRAKLNKSLFEHIQVLGIGAFGEVNLVRKRDDHGRLYAMKILHKSDIFNRNQAAHVKAERDILAEADNEWVVKLYYSFQDEQNLYFVMDYVPGGDLMNLLIKFQVFSEELARFYIGELTCAIESVHNLGFIHRDIKPDNILIDQRGHIKLTDFGLCTGFHWTHNSKYYQIGKC